MCAQVQPSEAYISTVMYAWSAYPRRRSMSRFAAAAHYKEEDDGYIHHHVRGCLQQRVR